ncbi:hypothetical protein Lal_00012988 [Lupinus albus]|uniref:Putative pectinesterase inhibitor domain-containing protein n=1 Tax=Lupinus albus TaxID=3870 RepID=A0A6A5NHM3_LUPAL|nr:putative pectinesterase inhibitor domain-containing protein [Lupinus albus]KAF1884028.1 hypothetical protein Lal_00012988 [Lupinus albus]
MCSSKVSMLLLYTLSIILISHAPFAFSDEVNIEDLCNEVASDGIGPTKDECLKFLNSNPKYRSADFHDISKFLMQNAIDKGLEDQKIFNVLAKNHTSSKAIKDCSNIHYPSTISNFRNALKDLDKNTDGAFDAATLARSGIENCDTMLYQEKLDASANGIIKNMNKFMAFLSDMSTAAIDLYSKDHP